MGVKDRDMKQELTGLSAVRCANVLDLAQRANFEFETIPIIDRKIEEATHSQPRTDRREVKSHPPKSRATHSLPGILLDDEK